MMWSSTEMMHSRWSIFPSPQPAWTAPPRTSKLPRGDADEVSDLDVIIAVSDDRTAEFAATWRERLHDITRTIMARPSFGNTGSWLAITPTCQRFDLWVEPASRVAVSPVHDRHLLFDRDGLAAAVPRQSPAAGPSPEKLTDLARRFHADAAVTAVADELLMLQVIYVLRWTLYDAAVEANRPLAAIGLKQWTAKLTDAQRERLFGLPAAGDPKPIIGALEEVLGNFPRCCQSPGCKPSRCRRKGRSEVFTSRLCGRGAGVAMWLRSTGHCTSI